MGLGIALSAIVPGLLTFVAIWFSRRWSHSQVLRPRDLSFAVMISYVLGFALLPQFKSWWPDRHWHWLVIVVPVSAFVGGIVRHRRAVSSSAFLAWGVLAALTAWLLVPAWPDLQPSRFFWHAVVAVVLLGQFVLLGDLVDQLLLRERDRLPANANSLAWSRHEARDYGLFLIATSAVTAMLIAYSVSIVYGQVCLIVASILLGWWIAWVRHVNVIELRQLVPCFVVATSGAAFVACVEPRQPVWGLLLASWAPAAMGVALVARQRRWTFRSTRSLTAMCVGIVLGAAGATVAWNIRPERVPDGTAAEGTLGDDIENEDDF